MSNLIDRLKRTEDPAARMVLLRARGAAHRAVRGHRVRSRTVERYLRQASEPKLHFGAGPVRLDGWLNTDLIAGDIHLDLERPLPLPDTSFQHAFGEHVIEHLSEQAGISLLAELRRVLRPGGRVRLTTPDLRKLIALYEDRNPVISLADYRRFFDDLTAKRHERPCQVLNDYLRLWGHRYVYDEEDLAAKLEQAGFRDVRCVEPGESEVPALRGLERHGGAEWVNRAEAMCLEATRP